MSEYKFLRVTGPVSVERHDGDLPIFSAQITLLLGLTGVGKSNFLECLHGTKTLEISGDSLESVTQEVICYRLVNVTLGRLRQAIYILDCPGFSDNQISEMRVVKMLQAWCEAQAGSPSFDSILYFHRITDKRLSGSQRRVLNLINTLIGNSGIYSCVGVVTTMWDTLWNDVQIEGANERFRELKEGHLKKSFGPTARKAFQFQNDQRSALEILDGMMQLRRDKFGASLIFGSMRDPPIKSCSHLTAEKRFRSAPFAVMLYGLLVERIEGVKRRLGEIEKEMTSLQDELGETSIIDDETMRKRELLRCLEVSQRENEEMLKGLEVERVLFGGPPVETKSVKEKLIGYFKSKKAT
ncbi:hypothetical protein CVT24_011037 [Panaeolus cyanescens]|uniref:Uncharacterized protein n=1 Tax=Panaeolus cyanescens TaxID=181874 RepID=A0A409VFZ1_9AGAR|nr:hypothetical protein CVT24_011037 [Panaeolus cyanescens]